MKDLVTYIKESNETDNIMVSVYFRPNSIPMHAYMGLNINIYAKVNYLLEMRDRLQAGEGTKDEEMFWNLIFLNKDKNYDLIDIIAHTEKSVKDSRYLEFHFNTETLNEPDKELKPDTKYYMQTTAPMSFRFSKNERGVHPLTNNTIRYNVVDFDKLKNDILNSLKQSKLDITKSYKAGIDKEIQYRISRNTEYDGFDDVFSIWNERTQLGFDKITNLVEEWPNINVQAKLNGDELVTKEITI